MKFLKLLLGLAFLISLSSVVLLVFERLGGVEVDPAKGTKDPVIAPVEVAPVMFQPMQETRQFTGTLDAGSAFVVASKIGGRIEEISVDMGDAISRGQVIARLDNDEYQQELNRVQAELAVTQANLSEAQSQLEIARRELDRIETLSDRGVSSAQESDTARANYLNRSAHLEVAQAEIQRAEADVESARIRLAYSDVQADWRDDGTRRSVAERFVDEGETVSANQPLLKVVKLDPLVGVFSVTERDYGQLKAGQPVSLDTDAYPGEQFTGNISRISPVFDEATRQARVEVLIPNPELRLNPGMFIRASVKIRELDRILSVPQQALVTRNGQTGVFFIDDSGKTARWQIVQTVIRQDQRIGVTADSPGIQVVVLGQQLLDDGSPVRISNDTTQ